MIQIVWCTEIQFASNVVIDILLAMEYAKKLKTNANFMTSRLDFAIDAALDTI